MTITLAYEPVLSRVQLTADTLGPATYATIERTTDQIVWATVRGGVQAPITMRQDLADTYTRSVSNGWGTPETGTPAWTHPVGVAADYATDGSTGTMLASVASTSRRAVAGPTFVDGRAEVELLPGVVALGASFEQGPILRHVDSLNFWTAEVRMQLAGALNLRLVKTVAGVATSVANVNLSDIYTATSRIRCVFECRGAELRAKAWNVFSPEPDWQLTISDTSIMGAGQSGCALRVQAGNLNVPLTVRYDNFRAGPLVATVDDYEFASGQVNTYRVTPTPRGLYLDNASGNFASTPDTAVLDIVGDIDLRADATTTAWITGVASGELDYFLTKYNTTGNQRSYALRLSTTGQLQLVWSNDGTAVISRTATVLPVPDPDTGRLAVRATLDVDNGAAGHTATFYTAPTIDGPWTQLGAPVVTAVATSIFSGTAALIAGAIDAGTSGLLPGFIHAAEVRSGINGTVVANPVFESQADATTSFADTAGRTWTVSGAAEIHGAQTANITPVLDSIWLKSVTRPFLNRKVTVVDWSPEERPSRTGGFPAVGRTFEIAVAEVAGGLMFDLDLHVSNQQDAQTLDYIRASGDILFLHTPLGCAVPGGHVCLDTTSARRPRPRGASRVFTLPLRQCAAPGPDVVGATSTWTTVLNSYASWAAVLAANPTWPHLLARIAPPSEVIVP